LDAIRAPVSLVVAHGPKVASRNDDSLDRLPATQQDVARRLVASTFSGGLEGAELVIRLQGVEQGPNLRAAAAPLAPDGVG
jgi:hypothetical protein